MANDAFDRAVKREKVLRNRAELFDSPFRLIRLFERFVYAVVLVWAALVAANWIWMPRPRWFAILDTAVFVIGAGWVLLATFFITFVRRRRPDWFE